jgi:diguanylate cyclase (GGDEF)-like protein
MRKGRNARAAVIDLPPLSERLQYLTGLRLAFAALVVILRFAGERFTGLTPQEVLPATLIFVAATWVNEFARRYMHRRGLPLLAAMLVMDGIYLAWVMFATGGPTSPLRFLIYMHLIAVTLLASYRTGLKVALWHSLMFFVAFYAQLAGWVEPFVAIEGTVQEAAAEFNRQSVLNIVAFWFVAIGTAMFSASNERELRRNRDDVGRLAGMAVELEEASEPRAVARVTLKRLTSNFASRRAAFIAGRDVLKILAYEGEVPFYTINPNSDALILQAWRDRKPRLVKQADADENPMIASLFPNGKGIVVVPLFAEARPVGAICMEYGEALTGIERREITLLEQFATYAGLALQNAWALEEIKRLAQIDPLTGLANRGTFQEALAREISRSERSGEPLSLVILDIDHFKRINDTWGHQIGDDVLRSVAAALELHKRDFDTASRYGGEEFAIILPGCSTTDSRQIADRFRARIEGLKDPVEVTGSVGVATYPTDATTTKDLIKLADDALYASKDAGRNRVTLAGDTLMDAMSEVPESTGGRKRVSETVPPLEL